MSTSSVSCGSRSVQAPPGASPASLPADLGTVTVADGRSCAPLRVVAQPEAEFFKDEGGKLSCLSVTVEAPASYICAPVALRCTLYYENGVRVDEADQRILVVTSHKFEPCVLTPAAPRVTITYRIEKVSRRKDNHRFRVYVEPVYAEGCAPPAAFLRGVLSGPTCVMSKRKTGERMVSVKTGEGVFFTKSEVKERPLAAAEVSGMFSKMSAQIEELQAALGSALERLEAQGRRLAEVEEARGTSGSLPSRGGPAEEDPLPALLGGGDSEGEEAASEMADDLSYLSELLGESAASDAESSASCAPRRKRARSCAPPPSLELPFEFRDETPAGKAPRFDIVLDDEVEM